MLGGRALCLDLSSTFHVFYFIFCLGISWCFLSFAAYDLGVKGERTTFEHLRCLLLLVCNVWCCFGTGGSNVPRLTDVFRRSFEYNMRIARRKH
jgi:hypothetical protein